MRPDDRECYGAVDGYGWTMIPIRKLHDLHLEKAEGDERSPFVAAASGIVHLGETLFVIADDERQLNVFPSLGRQPGYQLQILEGEVPDSDEERAKKKPDLESVAILPPSEHFEHGALISLGSGTKKRDIGAVVVLGPDGLPTGEAKRIDMSDLYDALRERIEKFNAEGAAVRGDVFHLFQRGADAGAPNGRIDISLDAFTEAVVQGRGPGIDDVGGITEFDLGRLRGVPLGFSDASPLEDGRLVFTCSAEASGPGDDGAVLGSALGIVDAGDDVTFLEPVDLEVKIEGMTALSADDGISVLLVTDGDDPDDPSPLLEARLPG